MSAAAILSRFPGLSVPYEPLGQWPTPLVEVRPGFWRKDEGVASAVYGGNKVRKLEWTLGYAVRNDYSDLVTTGATGSHHVVAVAAHARTLEIETHAVLFPQPLTPHVLANRAVAERLCVSLAEVSSPVGVPFAVAARLFSLWRLGRRPLWIGPGASDARATVGWIGGGLELAAQLGDRGVKPDRIVVAAGSAGTAAGLLAGLRLAGDHTPVVAARCVPAYALSAARIRRIARSSLAYLRRSGASVPGVSLDGLTVDDGDFVAYGVGTAATERAAAEGRALGLGTEITYTARSLARALDDHRRGLTVVWVDTVHPGALL